MNLELRVDDRPVVDLAGAYGVVVRSPGDEVAQAFLVLDLLAREDLGRTPLGEGARRVQFAGLLDAEKEPLDIRVLAEVVGMCPRWSARASQPPPAPRR